MDSSKLRSEAQRVRSKTRHSKRQPPSSAEPEAGEERLAVLLSWCQAVCGAYGLTVVNFRTSFADARGLCLLVRGHNRAASDPSALHFSHTDTAVSVYSEIAVSVWLHPNVKLYTCSC